MSDTPERIWAWAHSKRSFLAYEDKPAPPSNATEYVRADIHEAVIAERDELRRLVDTKTDWINATINDMAADDAERNRLWDALSMAEQMLERIKVYYRHKPGFARDIGSNAFDIAVNRARAALADTPRETSLSELLRQSALRGPMSDAETREQRESWVRGMTTRCEHGEIDFEQCPECRGVADTTDAPRKPTDALPTGTIIDTKITGWDALGCEPFVPEADAVIAIAQARQEGWNAAIEAAAYQASNACLVPPDGGSPTEAEVDMCEEAARRIRALTMTEDTTPKPIKPQYSPET